MRADIVLFLILILATPASRCWSDQTTVSAADASTDEDPTPSMDLLEFLGAWETDDGEWIDPTSLEDPPLPEQESTDE